MTVEDLGYKPRPYNDHVYDLADVNVGMRFADDPVVASAANTPENLLLESHRLSSSGHWQDRIRAEILRREAKEAITLPDGFPCIYEPADPHYATRRPFVWVASPDADMLQRLLPYYQELWRAYASQWPGKVERTLLFGHLDGLPTTGVYRPGTTHEQVIGDTMMTHNMYALAPEHLRRMHPQHEQWTRSQAERAAR